jgi:hypothetical protein
MRASTVGGVINPVLLPGPRVPALFKRMTAAIYFRERNRYHYLEDSLNYEKLQLFLQMDCKP